MKRLFLILPLAALIGCDSQLSSDDIQRNQQEQILQEATKQTGMPAIKNFRERKILKDILELRDQDGLVTWTYTQNAYTGKFRLLGETVGYGIPYSTQYTNPEKLQYMGSSWGYHTLPQADPNGLYSPSSAEGTWVLMKDPGSSKIAPVYIEQRIIVSPFKLPAGVVEN